MKQVRNPIMQNNLSTEFSIKALSLLLDTEIEKNYGFTYQLIISTNLDVNYKALIDNVFDYLKVPMNTQEGVLILEAYTLFSKITANGITDDNYLNIENKFNNALKHLNDIVVTKIDSPLMPPKPSQVLYALKYFLYNHFGYEKEIVKVILDYVGQKDNKDNTRMPKKNNELDEYINRLQDSKIHLFNSIEGNEKYQYFGLSIFDFQELMPHRSSVYPVKKDA